MPKLISAHSGAAGGCAWVTAELVSVFIYVFMFCELFPVIFCFFFLFCRVFQSSPLVRNVVNTSYSRFWKWDCLLNHHIHSISNAADIKAGQVKRTKRCLPPNLTQQHKTNIKLLDYKFYCNYSIYKVLCNRDLNSLESLLTLSETFWLTLCWLVAFGSTICKDV